MDDAHAAREIEHAADLDRLRRRVAGAEIIGPGEIQPADGAGVDLGQRAEMLLAEGAAIAGPFVALIAIDEQRVVRRDRLS